MSNAETRVAPEKVWLQRMSEDYKDGWTWCWHDVGECEDPDVEYIRHDIAEREGFLRAAEALEAEAKRQEALANTTMDVGDEATRRWNARACDYAARHLRQLHEQAERGGTHGEG